MEPIVLLDLGFESERYDELKGDRKLVTHYKIIYEGKRIDKLNTVPFKFIAESTVYEAKTITNKTGLRKIYKKGITTIHFNNEYKLNINDIKESIDRAKRFSIIYYAVGYCATNIACVCTNDGMMELIVEVYSDLINGEKVVNTLSIYNNFEESNSSTAIRFHNVLPLINNEDIIEDIFDGKYNTLQPV